MNNRMKVVGLFALVSVAVFGFAGDRTGAARKGRKSGSTPVTFNQVFVSEVHPSGSGNISYQADWFEVTNNGTSALDITGWKVDDSSNLFANAVALRGVTSIPPGGSAVFFKGDATGTTGAAITAAFSTAWFGSATPPEGVLIGAYGGSGVGLSTGGDAIRACQRTSPFPRIMTVTGRRILRSSVRATGGYVTPAAIRS